MGYRCIDIRRIMVSKWKTKLIIARVSSVINIIINIKVLMGYHCIDIRRIMVSK